jgi:hypothetical protein
LNSFPAFSGKPAQRFPLSLASTIEFGSCLAEPRSPVLKLLFFFGYLIKNASGSVSLGWKVHRLAKKRPPLSQIPQFKAYPSCQTLSEKVESQLDRKRQATEKAKQIRM